MNFANILLFLNDLLFYPMSLNNCMYEIEWKIICDMVIRFIYTYIFWQTQCFSSPCLACCKGGNHVVCQLTYLLVLVFVEHLVKSHKYVFRILIVITF